MTDTSSHIGIVYYSRSGHSERLARRLSNDLNAEVVAITVPTYDPKWWGYARAGFDSLRQRGGDDFECPPLTRFNEIILCGPVWTSYPAVPLRQLMRSAIPLPSKVSLFLTCGAHSPAQKALAAAQADLGRPFAAFASLPNSAEGTAQEEHIITRFLTDLAQVQQAILTD